MEVSVVIPVGPYHAHLVQRAIQSVLSQTEKCALVVSPDTEGRGAGWARNRGLERVTTPYTLFLDADDWLESDAVAVLLAAAKDAPEAYLYPDWYAAKGLVIASDCCYCLPEYRGHTITALVRTDWLREIGGFDESLPFLEDTDLWMKLRYVGGHTGVHVGRALLHYSPDGQRSEQAIIRRGGGVVALNAEGERIRKTIVDRYKGAVMPGCCINRSTDPAIPAGAHLETDVLAVALWMGMGRVVGRVSRRVYRGGNLRRMWVDPRDVAAEPHKWRVVNG